MRILFLGDIVGKTGRDAVLRHMPALRDAFEPDCVIVNAENAAHGFGLTPSIAEELFSAGIDCLTLGNHAFDKKEVIPLLEADARVVRPLNYPVGTPGRGASVIACRNGGRVLVANVMGRLFMDALDDPFAGIERQLDAHRLGQEVDAIVVDFHSEASSEKMAMGHFCNGRASLVVGTHTHVPTADAQVLPGGTAYQSDAGMCGDYDSIIGMKKQPALAKMVTKLPGERFAPSEGEGTVCGVFVETGTDGLAIKVLPVRVGPRLLETSPAKRPLGHAAKIQDFEHMALTAATWRARGETVGFTNGCYDLLHAGHLFSIAQARQYCDRLIIGINSDASVRTLKGPNRPVHGEATRAAVLASLADVDGVVIFGQETPLELIETVRPDVLVKGRDYEGKLVVGRDFVEANGGKVILADMVPGVSTTSTIARMSRE